MEQAAHATSSPVNIAQNSVTMLHVARLGSQKPIGNGLRLWLDVSPNSRMDRPYEKHYELVQIFYYIEFE